jgi:hypothetical protein
MRSKLIVLLLGCGLVAATMAPSFACQYNLTTASDTQAPQQTAQAQSPQQPATSSQ